MKKVNITVEYKIINEKFNGILVNLEISLTNISHEKLLIAKSDSWGKLYQNIGKIEDITNHNIEYLNYGVTQLDEHYRQQYAISPIKREADGNDAMKGKIDKNSYKWVDISHVLDDANGRIEELLKELNSLINDKEQDIELVAESSVLGELSNRENAAKLYLDSIMALDEKDYIEFQRKQVPIKERISQAGKELNEKENANKQNSQEKQREEQIER